MPAQFIGMPFSEGSAAHKANQEEFTIVKGPRTGKNFEMRDFTYGVLDSDPHSPLSCVSVANSSLSIDMWKGCAWQCSYCHVQGALQDLNSESLTMPVKPEARARFSVDEVVSALIEHPFFEPNESIISIGTASTEPLARGKVSDSTFEIMERFIEEGYENPFWIVTKAGYQKGYEERLKAITDHGNKVMLSICWANNPKEIEPMQTNRFRNIELARQNGATISWYLRPLAEGWSTDPETLEESFREASKYRDSIDMIIPGGLRWTEGIEYGVEEVRNLVMPEIPKDDNVKDLSDETWAYIHELSEEYFPGVAVYHKSSCGLSYMLGIPNHNLVQKRNTEACLASDCPLNQRGICGEFEMPTKEVVQSRLAKIGLGEVLVETVNAETGNLTTKPPLGSMTFALKHMIEIQSSRP